MKNVQPSLSSLAHEEAVTLRDTRPQTSGSAAVFGLGFVGLPLALSFCLRGWRIDGVDISQELIDTLQRGVTNHLEQYQGRAISELLSEFLEAGCLQLSTQSDLALSRCSMIIVTVGIPIRDGKPIFDPLISATRSIGRGLKQGDTVVFRSTMVPGTTEELLQPILERESGLTCGLDFHLAYSPERIAEGRAFQEFEELPTIVSGVDSDSIQSASELLRVVCRAPIVVAPSIRAAEASKVLENASRDVNIALVNEFARYCEADDLDPFQVIQAANTHPRVNLLSPGPGVGGFCIPNAYYYLAARAELKNVALPLMAEARNVNDQTPVAVIELLERELKRFLAIPLESSRIAVFGVAMKDYSNDIRLSPALKIIADLHERGASVRAFDPNVHWDSPLRVESLETALHKADAILVLARQKGILDGAPGRWARFTAPKCLLLDTRNAIDRAAAQQAGYHYVLI